MRWIGQVPKIIVQAEEKIVEVPQAQTRGNMNGHDMTDMTMNGLNGEGRAKVPAMTIFGYERV